MEAHKPHGQGERVYRDGTRYTGQFEAGNRCGEGHCHYANGDVYQVRSSAPERCGVSSIGCRSGSRPTHTVVA